MNQVIEMRKQEIQLAPGCGICHMCKNKPKRSRDDRKAVVHSLLRKHSGPRTYLVTEGDAIRRGDNDRCLLMQALFAFADGKDCLSEGLKVSDLVDVWLKSERSSCDQETRQSAGIWLPGKIMGYDPVAIAWRVEFQQFRDGKRMTVDDGWFQLWRSDEHVARSVGPAHT